MSANRAAARALPPQHAEADGRSLTITRAWPGKRPGQLAVETVTTGELGAPRLRGGWWEGGELDLLPHGEDPKLDRLAALAREGEVISHRPHKRAVVHLAEHGVYVKVVRSGKAAGILAGIERAYAFDGPFRTPEVVGSDESTVTLSALAGVSLHQPEQLPGHLWRQAWGEVTAAWLAAAGSGATTAAQIPAHTAQDEARVLSEWAVRAGPYVENDHALASAAEKLAAQLVRLPDAQLAPAHRDLHDKQLLWSPAGPGLLDVDTACLADPALDLGNLLAHARLRRVQCLWTQGQADVVVHAAEAAALQAKVSAPRLRAYTVAALLRLGCVYAVRPQYVTQAAILREEAQREI